ncbi:hypothetical protein [Catenulispora rubra]|uniref:hypothetical protein n=1 Tax=Catenulispora rubra TaxID=280293 RepID=UPI002B275D3F|nr:hypothetical protein [Catenulispora rubra]
MTAIALGVVTAAGVSGTATASSTPSGSAAATSLDGVQTAAPQISTLPNGDRVLVFGSGAAANVAVFAPDGNTVPFMRYAPNTHHAYVIPDSILAAPGQLVASQYEIPALSTASPLATPHYPLRILQVNAVGLDGQATDGVAYLTDTDDANRWSIPIPIVNGVARVAIPAGHYAATTGFQAVDPATNAATVHAVTQLDVTVADTGVSTMTVDERTATAQITADTPRPAVNDNNDVVFNTTDGNGVVGGVQVSTEGRPIYVSPTAAPKAGKFSYQVFAWGGESPAGTADPYRYEVMFPAADHIDADQTYTVDASTLATVHNTIDTDPSNTKHRGEFMTAASSPGLGGSLTSQVVTVPGKLTTYYGAPVGDANYVRVVVPTLPSGSTGFPSTMFFSANEPTYAGPTETWRTWGHGPLTPQVGQYPGKASCRSCADGGTVDLVLNRLQDSSPDTVVAAIGPATGHLSVYRDGNQVFSQDNTSGVELTGQAQQPGTYRMVFDQDVSQFPITQSTATHTDVTVPYTPAPDPKWTLPSGDFCNAQGSSTTPCSILPVLNLNYRLATDDTDTGHGPLTALTLTVGHQSYAGAGAQTAATGATVSVSYDKGATWTAASVIPAGQNHFVALWKNGAAKGSTPWLKVTATDALGGSIAQTVANAYTIG